MKQTTYLATLPNSKIRGKYAALETTPCAAFSKERRMKFANATPMPRPVTQITAKRDYLAYAL